MNELTERQIKLLKGAVDYSISTLGGQLVSFEEAKRVEARDTLKEYIELSETLTKIKPKK